MNIIAVMVTLLCEQATGWISPLTSLRNSATALLPLLSPTPGPSPLDQPHCSIQTGHTSPPPILPTSPHCGTRVVLIRSHLSEGVITPSHCSQVKKQHLSMTPGVACGLALSCPPHVPHAFKPESSQPLSLRASAHPSWIFLEHSSPFSMLN